MNHELVMLRGLGHCRKKMLRLQEECLNCALKSFSTEFTRDGTIGQVRAVAQLVVQKENLEKYIDLVKSALADMPRGYRALIVAVYVKKISKEELCRKYKISVSTVYRKLAKARTCFRSKLEALGCTESWFAATYGENDWINCLLERPRNGARMAE